MARQLSLGLIETSGLLSAITAADAAMKSAEVALVGYEFAKGSGMTTVKIEGDVAAVNAAIAAAEISVKAVGRVVSSRVIARPADGLSLLTRNKETVRAELRQPRAAAEDQKPQSREEEQQEQAEPNQSAEIKKDESKSSAESADSSSEKSDSD